MLRNRLRKFLHISFYLFGFGALLMFAALDLARAQSKLTLSKVSAPKSKIISQISTSSQLALPIVLDTNIAEDKEIREIIAPYRAKLRQVFQREIAHTAKPLELLGAKDSSLGPLLAKILFEEANLFTEKYHYPKVDVGFMGFHGVRKHRLQGGISIADLYELMPFENTLSIVALSSDNLRELAERFVKDHSLHPVYGMEIWIADAKIKKILIQGRALNPHKTYYVAVPSYWAEGGDHMLFFTQGLAVDTRIKIRDLFIKYIALMQDIRPADLPKLSVHGFH